MKSKKEDNLSSSALKTSLGNFFSRLSGLFRDMMFAQYFGTGAAMSAFLTALTFPNLARRVFGEGALTASFIPLLSEKIDNKEEADTFSSNILSIATVLTTALTSIAILFCLVLSLLTKNYTHTVATLTTWLLPYMIFICLSALISGILNLKKSFTLPAISSVFLNIFLIAGCFVSPLLHLDDFDRIYLLISAVLLSGIIQLIVLFYALKRNGITLRWLPSFKTKNWLNVKYLFIPGIIGASVTQLSVLSDKFIANFIGDYAVSALYYAERLTYFPVGIFGVALGVACLPFMSKAISDNNPAELIKSFQFALRQTFFLTLPCTLLFYLYHTDIIKAFFMRGEFNEASLKESSLALMYYLPGIPAFAAIKIILPLYYASKDTRTPFKIAMSCLILNICLGIALIPFLKHASLAFATTLASYLNCCLLLIKSPHSGLKESLINSVIPVARVFFSCLISCIIVYCLPWKQTIDGNAMNIAIILFTKVTLSYLLFLFFHASLGGKELHEIIKRKNLT
jgi:putative peptidoglycan lipid II flippase